MTFSTHSKKPLINSPFHGFRHSGERRNLVKQWLTFAGLHRHDGILN